MSERGHASGLLATQTKFVTSSNVPHQHDDMILQVLVQLGGSLFQVCAPTQPSTPRPTQCQPTNLSSRDPISTLSGEGSGHKSVVQALAHAARSLGGERAMEVVEFFGQWTCLNIVTFIIEIVHHSNNLNFYL